MADEPKEAEAKDGDAKATGAAKKKTLPLLWIIIAVVVLAGGGGGAFFFFKKKETPPAAAADPAKAEEVAKAAEQHGEGAGGKSAEGIFFDLDPFVVNLADSTDVRYLKVTMKVELTQPTVKPQMDEHVPQIRDSLLVLLSSKDYASIRSVEGKMDLRSEIIQRINAILQGNKVKNVYFTEFIAQ